jgi:hypothetical protein
MCEKRIDKPKLQIDKKKNSKMMLKFKILHYKYVICQIYKVSLKERTSRVLWNSNKFDFNRSVAYCGTK